MNLSLVWLRRDLRLDDHAALATAMAGPGAVQPVFVFDTEILARFDNPEDRRLPFIMGALQQLHAGLRQRGGGLLVLHGRAVEVIPKLAAALSVDAVVSAEDFEPTTRARAAAVKKAVTPARFVQVVDHVIRAPYQVLKEDGTPFRVFTPFYKRWLASLTEMDGVAYDYNDTGRYAAFAESQRRAQEAGLRLVDMNAGPAAALAQIGYRWRDDPLWQPDAGQGVLADFMDGRVTAYPKAREVMAAHGTSRLSPYLRHGLVSIRACLRAARAVPGSETWVKELCWREFYMMILYHWPEVAAQEFMPQYRGTLPWSDAGKTALYSACTGYPIIDAALRELFSTGWMHNRARMIVASFFTKDLLLDWRIGEECFAQFLMDYELASNNGGWQWAASTGTDAAPYFRVFNPVLQSKKFDLAGDYIRRYVPELNKVPSADIHWPHGTRYCPKDYPAPIVDHAMAKQRAVEAFRVAKNT